MSEERGESGDNATAFHLVSQHCSPCDCEQAPPVMSCRLSPSPSLTVNQGQASAQAGKEGMDEASKTKGASFCVPGTHEYTLTRSEGEHSHDSGSRGGGGGDWRGLPAPLPQ